MDATGGTTREVLIRLRYEADSRNAGVFRSTADEIKKLQEAADKAGTAAGQAVETTVQSVNAALATAVNAKGAMPATLSDALRKVELRMAAREAREAPIDRLEQAGNATKFRRDPMGLLNRQLEDYRQIADEQPKAAAVAREQAAETVRSVGRKKPSGVATMLALKKTFDAGQAFSAEDEGSPEFGFLAAHNKSFKDKADADATARAAANDPSGELAGLVTAEDKAQAAAADKAAMSADASGDIASGMIDDKLDELDDLREKFTGLETELDGLADGMLEAAERAREKIDQVGDELEGMAQTLLDRMKVINDKLDANKNESTDLAHHQAGQNNAASQFS